MSYIYKIINNINNKIYIGKTNDTIENRFKRHIIDSHKEAIQNRPLYKAMNKYGIENFSIEKIEECYPNIVDEREKYWIEYYGSFKYGYNATLGGDGKAYLDYDLIYKTYLQEKNCNKVAKIIGCSSESVSKIIENFGITKEIKKKNDALQKSKSVAMIDKNTKETLKVFNSTHEAGKFLGKTHQHIQEVCQGKRKTAYGYIWKYLD